MTPTRLDLSDAAISEFRFLEPKPFWVVRRHRHAWLLGSRDKSPGSLLEFLSGQKIALSGPAQGRSFVSL